MATAKKRGAKVAPKPTVVDQIPKGWYPSETDGPPPRPVDAPSGPTVNYKQFSIPDPFTKGKRMDMWMRSTPDNADPNTGAIPNATGRPQANMDPASAWPTPVGQQTSKGPNMATPKYAPTKQVTVPAQKVMVHAQKVTAPAQKVTAPKPPMMKPPKLAQGAPAMKPIMPMKVVSPPKPTRNSSAKKK